MFRMGERLLFPLQAIWFLFPCLKNKILKGHANFSRVFVEEKGDAFLFRSNARDNQSRLQSDYSWGYSAEDYSLGWMAGTCYFSICCFLLSLSLLFSVWERDGEEDWQCVFPGCTSVERVCRSLSVSVSFTVKSKTEVVISRSHAGSLYLNKAAFVLLKLCLPPSYTLLTTSTGGINSLSCMLNPCTLILILT